MVVRLSIALLFCGLVLQAQPVRLALDPEHTTIEYALKATLHTVEGTFALKSGQVDYDLATGEARGEIVIDATSGASGNDSRDSRMHKAILESADFPEIKFIPARVEATSSESELLLHGQFFLHGQPHEMAIPATISKANGRLHITSDFQIPYVEWGLKNPSTFFLKVADTVQIRLEADAKIAEN